MKYKCNLIFILSLLICLNILFIGFIGTNSQNSIDFGKENQLLKKNGVGFLNCTIVSDGFGGEYWNSEGNGAPDIAIDNDGTIHVVWADNTDGVWGSDREIMYAKSSDGGITWSNATVISDGYNGKYWNIGSDYSAKIVVDSKGKIHVAWETFTWGPWGGGSDTEVLYVSNDGTGWSNVTSISDGYNGDYWNTGGSGAVSLIVDDDDNIHAVWTDSTDGPWGGGNSDYEIMYAINEGSGWSNATVISDGYNGKYWNINNSLTPDISIDNIGNIHVVWEDETEGPWGGGKNLAEIMHTSFNGIEWSNVTIISDDETNWNNGESSSPKIAIDNSNKISVIWADNTDGVWGTDEEIMCISSSDGISWSNITVISDGYNGTYIKNSVSRSAEIEIDEFDIIHVIWEDSVDMYGPYVIGYSYYQEGNGWSNMSIISDGYEGYYWSDNHSVLAAIAIDNLNIVNVVWSEWSSGPWGYDPEVMYTKIIDNEGPEIILPEDFSYKEGETGNYINWLAIDLFPMNYKILRNNNEIDNGFWKSGNVNSLNIDGLSRGIYDFIFEVFDKFNQMSSEIIKITVSPNGLGTIPFGSSWIFISIISLIGIAIYVKKKKL